MEVKSAVILRMKNQFCCLTPFFKRNGTLPEGLIFCVKKDFVLKL